MADLQQENLRALEGLMSEFFQPNTPNERKRSIEELLNNFSQQKDSWQYCLSFIEQTNNEYVMMYCLSVLETVINKKWHGLQTDSKKIIRETIIHFLMESHAKLPQFIVNKMSKLNVDIARHDWPHFYHNFLTNILELMQRPDTTSLGVILLQTTSEEMAHPREDLSIARKQELQQLLLENMPAILTTLSGILDGVLAKQKLQSTAKTPPPSPNRSWADSNQYSRMFQSPIQKPANLNLSPSDKSSIQLCSLVLSCISHLFSWIPLSSMITSSLLNSIFSFAAFGCEAKSLQSTDNQGQSLGILAMCCINELLNKNCVPSDFESYLLQLFQQTFYLLKKLTDHHDNVNLTVIDSDFLNKFTEFVRLFVNNHLRRFEANPEFPVLEFLSLLYEYTFQQPNTDEFYACLDIWQIFIDYIKGRIMNRTNKDSTIARYYDGIMALVKRLIERMQCKHNQRWLDMLDDTDIDDDGLTELQRFISYCNDTVVMIAELIPDDVISIINTILAEQLTIYYKMADFLSNTSQHSIESVRRVNSNLKDLCVALQMIARMVDTCTGEQFNDRFTHTDKLVKGLIELAIFNEKQRFFSRPASPLTKRLVSSFIEVCAQTLSSLKAYSHWLSQYYLESFHKPGIKERCTEMVTAMINCIIPTISPEMPEKVLEWSVNVFSSLLILVRPVYLYNVPCVQDIYNKVNQGYSASLPPKVSSMLCKSMSSYLILRWPALPDSEQKWEMRTDNHSSFIRSLHPQFLLLKTVTDLTSTSQTAQQARTVIITTLTSLHDLVLYINEEPKKTKEIMYRSITEYIQLSLQLFSVYISESEVLEKIVDFFLVLIRCLRLQMGITFTEQTIQTFLDLFTKDRLVQILSQENQMAYKVVESFLKMLEVIVQDSSSSFRRLLPNIISICMDHIYPLVAPKPNPDIKLPLYELLFEILNSNWKYFYKSSVIKTFGGVNPSEPLEHQSEFVAIIHSFGQSFLQPDITIFKYNLEALEKLNQKWKLYHKSIFLESMMSQFLNVLLQTLVIKSHDLLQEEIITAVYNMASVDFSMFYKTFIPGFLEQVNTIDFYQKETLRDNLNPEDQDLPTFTCNVLRMVNDLRYYTIVNASLPPGTIDLSQKEPEPISEY